MTDTSAGPHFRDGFICSVQCFVGGGGIFTRKPEIHSSLDAHLCADIMWLVVLFQEFPCGDCSGDCRGPGEGREPLLFKAV